MTTKSELSRRKESRQSPKNISDLLWFNFLGIGGNVYYSLGLYDQLSICHGTDYSNGNPIYCIRYLWGSVLGNLPHHKKTPRKRR